MNDLATEYPSSRFTHIQDTHTHGTRNSLLGNLRVPKPKTEKYKQSLSYKGAHVWNNLPPNVKSCETIHAFKHTYRKTTLPGTPIV